MAEETKKKVGIGKVLFAIIFFPIFLIWLVWRKTNWKSYIKGFVTAVILLFAFGVLGAANSPSLPTSTQTNVEQPSEPKEICKDEPKILDVDFETKNQDDSTLEKGKTKVSQEGQKGQREEIWTVCSVEGKMTSRKLKSDKIIKEPVTKLVSNGTYVAPQAPTPQPTPSAILIIAEHVCQLLQM